jgi:hypothetical protein
MNSKHHNLLSELGFLRIALLIAGLLNILLPLIEILVPLAGDDDKHHFWSVMTGVIAPVMAPLLIVVILFDYIMTRVRAADGDGELRNRFIRIGRIELAMLCLMMLFWVPYFIFKL